jgi:hypothetical protein
MATLTITGSANGHDRERVRDLDNNVPWRLGGVGSSGSNTAYGMGFRAINVTLSGTDTITDAYMDVLKSSTQFSQMDQRWVFTDEDNRGANWSASSPNRPGDPAIQSSFIAVDTANISHTDAVRYQFPSDGTEQGTLGSGGDATISRAGWASGNALAVVCNSDQDASAYENFSRKSFHDVDSATASSEPSLVITYTAGGGGRTTKNTRSFPLGVNIGMGLQM